MGFRGQFAHGNPEPLMSALGQKQTLRRILVMSALPPKADIAERDWHVRFVPKAAVSKCGNAAIIRFPSSPPNRRARICWRPPP